MNKETENTNLVGHTAGPRRERTEEGINYFMERLDRANYKLNEIKKEKRLLERAVINLTTANVDLDYKYKDRVRAYDTEVEHGRDEWKDKLRLREENANLKKEIEELRGREMLSGNASQIGTLMERIEDDDSIDSGDMFSVIAHNQDALKDVPWLITIDRAEENADKAEEDDIGFDKKQD